MRTAEFRRYLADGRGNAVLLLRADPENPEYRAALREACIQDQRYDGAEENRGSWLAGLMALTGDDEPYRQAVLDELANGDWSSSDQLFDLARNLAEAGDVRFRTAIRDAFAARGLSHAGLGGAEAVVALDGLAGLLLVLAHPGDPAHPDRVWWTRMLITHFPDYERVAIDYPQIRRALEEVEPERCSGADRAQLDGAPWERVRDVLESGAIAARGSRWGKLASGQDLFAAAEWLIASRHRLDATRLRDGLSLFQDAPFPGDPAVLAEILRDARAAGHPKVVACAATALAQLSHPICRDISRELMPSPEYRNDAIDLLVRNSTPSDYEELAPWVREAVTDDQREAIGMSLRLLAEAHPDPGAVPLLLHQYETGACSVCRYGLVKQLLAQNALPDEIREECRHDADPETRALVASEGGESC